MILYTSPNGFTLTSEHLSVLCYAAGTARDHDKARKTEAEHVADDILWDLGWFVPGRVPPEERTTAGGTRP